MSFYTRVRPCDLYPYARCFYHSKWLPNYVQNPLTKLHRLPPEVLISVASHLEGNPSGVTSSVSLSPQLRGRTFPRVRS